MKSMKWKLALLTAATTAFLAGCGGGGADPTSQRAGITSVKVMGDSLSDSGVFKGIPTYGRMFSVQDSASEPNTVWTERIAALLGAPQLCNFFKTALAPKPSNPLEYAIAFTSPATNCTNYAVGGGRINNFDRETGADQSPFSIPYQMTVAASFGNYKSSDLLLVDGGGNDAADLVGAYLMAGTDSGLSFARMAGTLIPPATLNPLLATGQAGKATAKGFLS
jgi:hypothetical protein